MFYSPTEFPFITLFERNWKKIRDEYRGLDKKILDVHRNGTHEDYLRQVIENNGWAPSWSVNSTEKNFSWLTYGLFYRGIFPIEANEKFPFLMALLTGTPGIHACAFSQMMPQSTIAPHHHPELGDGLLTFHLGLELKADTCGLYVNDIFESEAEGKSIVFDGSVKHSARNASKVTRTILYVEFDRSKIT